MAQLPPLWGSKQDVLASNFLPRTLSEFVFTPAASNFRAPPGWGGKLTLLFVLKDGTPQTKVRGYVRSELSASALNGSSSTMPVVDLSRPKRASIFSRNGR